MEAQLNKPDAVHYYCEKKADFFNIWLNPKLLVPLAIDCWIDNVRLIYDPVARTTSNSPGVTIRIPGFGRSDVVEWLDPSITKSLAGAYFKDVGNLLVAHGYERNVTLRGAPFDFRKSPSRLLILLNRTAISQCSSQFSFAQSQMRTNNGFWI